MKTLLESSQKTAVAFGDETITYSQLMNRTDCYYELIEEQKASKILIYSENRPEYLYAFYAGWKKKCTIVPVDHLATPDELLYIINDCKPEIIFTSRQCHDNVKKAMKGVRRKINVFEFEKIRLKKPSASTDRILQEDLEKTALLIYTSGTTGSPKGVMLSFKNLFRNIDAVVDVGIYNENECVLVLLPIHHILPLLGTIIAPLAVQAKIAMSPSMVTDDILRTLSDNRVSVIVGVPRFYEVIAKGIMDKINGSAVTRLLFSLAARIDSMSFSRKLFKKVHDRFGGAVKYMVSGGAALDQDVARAFTTLGFEVLEGYGMTEAAPMITFPRPGNVKLGTTGQPLPGIEIRTVKGEIQARGENIMQGYYNRPEETAAVLKNGWLHTGDLGEIDGDNFLRITGRKKEIIVLPNGKNINPAEIEEKLLKMSSLIQETAVYLKDNKLQVLFHFNRSEVTADPESERKTAYDIVSRYNQSVSSYKKIMKYNITRAELPKTRLGKIKRHELAAMGGEEQRKSVKPPKYREYTIIRDFLENETGSTIMPDDHFEFDLGLDSLSKVSLLVFLEKTFGLKLKDDHLNLYPNLLKLSEHVKEKKVKLQESLFNWTDILKEKVQVKLPKSWFTTELFKYTGKGLFKVFFHVRGYGRKNIPRAPFIIAPNHQSFFDGLFVAIFLRRRQLKNTFFYAKAKHVNNRFLKFLARINNVIIVDINNDLKGSIQQLAEVLRKGKSIIIFPEGTRTKDGEIGDFKQTFAILSRELMVPVVPVAIKGAFEVLPRGRKLPRVFRQVSVDFLEPVYPENKSYKAIAEAVKKIHRGNTGAEEKEEEVLTFRKGCYLSRTSRTLAARVSMEKGFCMKFMSSSSIPWGAMISSV